MERAIQLLGQLLLVFIGFVVPIVGLLISLFREGISKLTAEFQNQRQQSEQNIKDQLQKLAQAETTDTTKVKESLKELEKIKKLAVRKISLLNPRNQMLRLTVPLLLSYVVLMFFPIKNESYALVLLTLLGCISVGYAIYAFWSSVGVLSEVVGAVNSEKKDQEKRSLELLSAIVDKVDKGSDYFLKNVYISVDNNLIKDDGVKFAAEVNKKRELKISVQNNEKRMAKNVEIGFIIPPDFIVEKSESYSLYTSETEQVVRYSSAAIHGNTKLLLKSLIVTPLKQETASIRTFVNAENIESISRKIEITV